MEVITLNQDNLVYWKKRATKNVIALGFFDGVHKGHCEVIRKAKQVAKEKDCALTVMSFFPHPKTVISNRKQSFDYIMPVSEKAKVLQTLGVDRFYVVEFDKNFASLSPESYVANYLLDFGVVHAVAGYDFTYGHRGKGNIDRLRYDANHQLDVTKVDKVIHQGRKISSTWVRELLAAGQIEELTTILGRVYKTVGKWNGNSMKLLPYYTLPRTGNYIVTLKVKEDVWLTEVNVDKEKGAILIIDNVKTMLNHDDEVSLIWRQQFVKKIAYASSVNE